MSCRRNGATVSRASCSRMSRRRPASGGTASSASRPACSARSDALYALGELRAHSVLGRLRARPVEPLHGEGPARAGDLPLDLLPSPDVECRTAISSGTDLRSDTMAAIAASAEDSGRAGGSLDDRSDRAERHARGERKLGRLPCCLPRPHGERRRAARRDPRCRTRRAHADVVADRARRRVDDLARARGRAAPRRHRSRPRSRRPCLCRRSADGSRSIASRCRSSRCPPAPRSSPRAPRVRSRGSGLAEPSGTTDDSEIDAQPVGRAAGFAGGCHSDGPRRWFGHGPTLAHRGRCSAAKWTMLAACASP